MSRKSGSRSHLRTGTKRIGKSKHSEWLMFIFENFGAQKFVYSDARDMLLERYNIILPPQTLGGWVRWGWLIAADKTMEMNPRIVYQIPEDVRKLLEAMQTGELKPRRSGHIRSIQSLTQHYMEDWERPWESERR